MKLRSFLPVASALFFAATTHAVKGDPAIYPPTIATTGTAEIRVRPDYADLVFDVSLRHANLTTARTDQAERATKVLAALRAAGIEDKDLQTSQVSISTVYVRDEHSESATVNYYGVSQTVSCTLRDVQKVAEVTTSVLLAGATGVGQATLRAENFFERRNEVRLQAAGIAKEKAEALAGKLKAKVGKPYSIVEDGPSNFSMQSNRIQDTPIEKSDGSQTTFAPGMISITSTVRVTFLLE